MATEQEYRAECHQILNAAGVSYLPLPPYAGKMTWRETFCAIINWANMHSIPIPPSAQSLLEKGE